MSDYDAWLARIRQARAARVHQVLMDIFRGGGLDDRWWRHRDNWIDFDDVKVSDR